MNNSADQHVKNCRECEAITRERAPEPMTMNVIPDEPWQVLASDFFEMPTEDLKILTLACMHSRVVWAWVVRDKTAETVIKCWAEAAKRYGKPHVIRTDNGPPFQSKIVKDWCTAEGIKLWHSIPLWPQSNGGIEAQHRGLKKALQAAGIAAGDREVSLREWKEVVDEYIYEYNCRPNAVTQIAPFQLLFKRPIRTNLPDKLENVPQAPETEEAKERDRTSKMKNANYANTSKRAKDKNIQVGDCVLIENLRTSKMTPTYDPEPWRVIDKQGTMLTLQSSRGQIKTRSTSQVKKTSREPESDSDNDEEQNDAGPSTSSRR